MYPSTCGNDFDILLVVAILTVGHKTSGRV